MVSGKKVMEVEDEELRKGAFISNFEIYFESCMVAQKCSFHIRFNLRLNIKIELYILD